MNNKPNQSCNINANKNNIKLSATSVQRRHFLKYTSIGIGLSCFSGLGCTTLYNNKTQTKVEITTEFKLARRVTFDKKQTLILKPLLLELFPADNNGPSAEDINAFDYISWALSDEKNNADGDEAFIKKALNTLNQQCLTQYKNPFYRLNEQQKQQSIALFTQNKIGENSVSLLIYYIAEALLLDPIYGGNTQQAGWHWLEHQAGYPRPDKQVNYLYFQSLFSKTNKA